LQKGEKAKRTIEKPQYYKDDCGMMRQKHKQLGCLGRVDITCGKSGENSVFCKVIVSVRSEKKELAAGERGVGDFVSQGGVRSEKQRSRERKKERKAQESRR